ncbi:hypothetical protein JTB14_025187 [Gonioctena quinquepunctata]|nr:hypothetical protein JTB14_025187 [Gonioctena quinquepunctata]
MESTGSSTDKSCSSSDEDEVTFLLRLKPTPTPPVRRKNARSTPQSAPKGWDVVIERKDLPSPPLSPPVSSRIRRFSLDSKRNGNSLPSRQFESIRESSTPPLPPKYLPSAPPQDLVENLNWYPKPYFPVPYYSTQVAIGTAFSSSYPNLNYVENGYYERNQQASLSPPTPRREFHPPPQLYGAGGENFAESYRHTGRVDPQTSYSVADYRAGGGPPRSPPPLITKPPKPLPRSSLMVEKGDKKTKVADEKEEAVDVRVS